MKSRELSEVIACRKCGALNRVPTNCIQQSRCGKCHRVFWEDRTREVVTGGWDRPWRKVPFVVFIGFLACSLVPWMRPTAPLGAGICLLAWLIHPYPKLLTRSMRTVASPIAVGLALATLGSILINGASEKAKTAQAWETSIIAAGKFIEPLGDPGLWPLIVGLVLAVGLSVALRKWKLLERAVALQKCAAYVYLVLVASVSVSYFCGREITRAAAAQAARVSSDYLKAELNFIRWRERTYQHAILAKAIAEEVERDPQLGQDLTNLAVVCRSSNMVSEVVEPWFQERFGSVSGGDSTARTSGSVRVQGWLYQNYSYDRWRSEHPTPRVNPTNPLWRSSEARKENAGAEAQAEAGGNAGPLTVDGVREGRAVVTELNLASERLKEEDGGYAEAVRLVLAKVMENGAEAAGVMPEPELVKQLAQKLCDVVADVVPVSEVAARVATMFEGWRGQCKSRAERLAKRDVPAAEAPASVVTVAGGQADSTPGRVVEARGGGTRNAAGVGDRKDQGPVVTRETLENWFSSGGTVGLGTGGNLVGREEVLRDQAERLMARLKFDARMKRELSSEEYKRYVKDPEYYARKAGYVCGLCGRPLWTPGCVPVVIP